MSDSAIVDTSVWIHALRKHPVPAIKSLLERLIDEDKIVMLPMIKLEILSGTRTDEEFLRLKSRLDALPVVSLSDEVWDEAERLAFRLRRKGIEIPLIDTLILACAKAAGSRLIHLDRHFEMAKKIADVRTENLLSKISITPH
jgi:predicted nucleic acid-binding protein